MLVSFQLSTLDCKPEYNNPMKYTGVNIKHLVNNHLCWIIFTRKNDAQHRPLTALLRLSRIEARSLIFLKNEKIKASCDLMASLQTTTLPAIRTQRLLSRETKDGNNTSRVKKKNLNDATKTFLFINYC